MKIEKKKIVFGSVLALVIIFIIAYALLVFGDDNDESQNLKETPVPELDQEQEEYKTKLDAINDLKEVRETNAPSIYDEKLLDSLGYYDRDLKAKRKERIVDSIYKAGRIKYTDTGFQKKTVIKKEPDSLRETKAIPEEPVTPLSARELGLEHQLFFASAPLENEVVITSGSSEFIHVEVEGEQTVKMGHRLKMRLSKPAVINGIPLPENSLIFGFIRIQPNRALINIENINHQPVKLKAFDLQDGSEGIYVENSLRAEASREVIGDIIQDINVAGLPQVGGIKKVFQRNNRSIKVTITNNYKLLLKASAGH